MMPIPQWSLSPRSSFEAIKQGEAVWECMRSWQWVAVLLEPVRVSQSGGRVLGADAVLPGEKLLRTIG